MVQIKIYREKQYYLSKYGEKQWLDGGDGDNTLVMAAMLTGKGLHTEEECFYDAFGETKEEVEKAIANYLKGNPNHPTISRTEVIKDI